jgi:hypothetical protein
VGVADCDGFSKDLKLAEGLHPSHSIVDGAEFHKTVTKFVRRGGWRRKEVEDGVRGRREGRGKGEGREREERGKGEGREREGRKERGGEGLVVPFRLAGIVVLDYS